MEVRLAKVCDTGGWLALVEQVRSSFPGLESREITVTTYREGVPEGAAARAFYKRLGFTEGKLTEELGSPVQEFRWKRSKGE